MTLTVKLLLIATLVLGIIIPFGYFSHWGEDEEAV